MVDGHRSPGHRGALPGQVRPAAQSRPALAGQGHSTTLATSTASAGHPPLVARCGKVLVSSMPAAFALYIGFRYLLQQVSGPTLPQVPATAACNHTW